MRLLTASIIFLIFINLAYNLPLDEVKPKGCGSKPVIYNVTFTTFWSQEKFPKQYPLWRPPAQWGQLVGRSHNSTFTLWRLGELATKGIQELAEQGLTAELSKQIQGREGLLDAFVTQNIDTGEGITWATFIADGKHSQISAVAKMVPSPDWFVGTDSFDLCNNGHWVEDTEIKMTLVDAGTDKGFTFTSPNWEERPPTGIKEITSKEPSHPANSFYYPDLTDLPTIASLKFQKLHEYDCPRIVPTENDASSTNTPSIFSTATQFEGNLEEDVVSVSVSREQSPKASNEEKVDFEETDQRNDQMVTVDLNDYPGLDLDEPKSFTTPSLREHTTLRRTTHSRRCHRNGKHRGNRHNKECRNHGGHSSLREDKVNNENTPEATTTYIRTASIEMEQLKDTHIDIGHDGLVSNDESDLDKQTLNPSSPKTDETEKRPVNHEFESEHEKETYFDKTQVLDSEEPEPDVIQKEELFDDRDDIYEPVQNSNINDLQFFEDEREKYQNETDVAQDPTLPVDCQMGWSEWGPCSVSCSYGTQMRSYILLVPPSNGGRPCIDDAPVQDETRLCGSMRNCQWEHFDFNNWSGKK